MWIYGKLMKDCIYIVVEIGNNYEGYFDVVKEMIC